MIELCCMTSILPQEEPRGRSASSRASPTGSLEAVYAQQLTPADAGIGAVG
jgi:hypothetical protein